METLSVSGIVTSLPGRYAKALFDLAVEKKQVPDVERSLMDLEKVIQSSKIVQHALVNPSIRRNEQASVLSQMCAQMEAPEIVGLFVHQLGKARRISYLPQILEIYQKLVLQSTGHQRVEVISAHPLTLSQRHFLQKTLAQTYSGILNITFKKDPRIQGGIIIRLGAKVIDASLATQLNQLATVMKGNLPCN